MATIPPNNNTGLYNTSGTAATTGNDITVTGNVNANNINAVNTVNAGTSVNAGTDVSAAGNIVASGYFVGDGSFLTNINAGNIVGSYGNANVASYLASGTNTSNVITTGNISGTYILGNGSQLTGLPATYSNANVNAHLAAFGSNTISTTGNITAGYFIGDGSQLTGLPASYGNANVAAFLPTYTGNLAGGNANITNDLVVGGTIYGTFSGNISGNLVVPGANTEVLYNNSGNAGASSDFTFNNATKVLAVNGNVNATQFNGSGAGLTNLPGANVTGTVANATYATSAGTATSATTAGTVTTAAQPNITSVGTLTSLTTSGNVNVGGSLNTDDVTSTGNITVYGNQVITGNLTVQGTTTTINSNTITTNDKTITVANNQSTGANVNGAGLEAGNPAVATWLYNDATTSWQSNVSLTPIANATQSLGTNTLRWLTVHGNVAGDSVSNQGDLRIYANGANLNLASPSMAMQNINMTATNVNVNGQVSATGNITGSYILGNGSQLTGLPAGYSNAQVASYLTTYSGNIGNITSDLKLTGNLIGLYGANSGVSGQPGIAITSPTPTDTWVSTPGATRVLLPGANFAGDLVSIEFTYDTTITDNGLAVNGNLFGTGNSITTTGNIATLGIKTDGYYYANGTPVTFGGGSGTYGNSNVAAFLAAYGSNTISTTGNITVGNIIAPTTLGVGGIYGRILSPIQSNITQVGTLGTLSVTGNVESPANYNGGNLYLTGLASVAGNISGANLNLTGGIYTSTGTLNIQDVNVNGNIIMDGLAGGGSSGANIDYINGGGYARFFGNVTTASGSFIAGIPGGGGIRYPNIDGTTGQVLTTYGNGVSYWNSPTVYGNSNVTSLLAAFGSNTISTSGNITAGNLNATSSISGATVAATGNISGGNISITGTVVAGGNISGNYILGNGSQLTGIVATSSYGNANVAAYLASGTNSSNIITTGNVTGSYITTTGAAGNITGVNYIFANYFSGNGSALTSITGANVTGTVALATTATTAGTVTTNAQPNITSVGTLTSLSVSGNITTGNILTNGYYYANGTPVSFGGGGSPGGSNTQIQFNDAGSFAGNTNITFDKTTGNIGLGNLIVNTQQIQTTQASNVGLTTSLTPNPGRVVLGTGYNGNTSPAYDLNNIGRGSRLLISDSIGYTDNNSLYRAIGVQNYYTLNANVSGGNVRGAAVVGQQIIGGGAAANTSSATTPFAFAGANFATIVGGGTSGNLTGLGNTVVQAATGMAAVASVNAGSTGGTLFGAYSQLAAAGTANTQIGYATAFTGGGTQANVYGVYMPGGTGTYGINSQNAARTASNYYFLFNEDDMAKNRMGMISRFQEFEYGLSSSVGAVTVDKTNGQVQFYTVSEAATMSFSNFVTSATVSSTTRYQTDTVTVIVQQDATGRTITMPSGTAYKYAAGSNTVPTTANSVSMISITAIYNTVTAATQYLITISPEFT